MIANGGLENWNDDTSPTSWTKAEFLIKSTDAYFGSFSTSKMLDKTINSIVPGDIYIVSFWCKVTDGDDQDARIWSTLKSGTTTVYHVGDSKDLLMVI